MKQYAVCLTIKQVECNNEGDYVFDSDHPILSTYDTIREASNALNDIIVEYDLAGLNRYIEKTEKAVDFSRN